MATSRRPPSCPVCASTFRRVAGGLGIYDPCPGCEAERRSSVLIDARKERADQASEDWARLREHERGDQAGDLAHDEFMPNPDDARRDLERRVGSGDTAALAPLIGLLLRSGQIGPADLRHLVDRRFWRDVVREDASRLDNEHQGFTNFETFLVAMALENNRDFYEGWILPVARRLWSVCTDEERNERDTTFSSAAVMFGDMIERAIAGWVPEAPIRTFSRTNLVDPLEPRLEAIGRPWRRDTLILGPLYSELLRVSVSRVDWRDLGAVWLHRAVPESSGYRGR